MYLLHQKCPTQTIEEIGIRKMHNFFLRIAKKFNWSMAGKENDKYKSQMPRFSSCSFT